MSQNWNLEEKLNQLGRIVAPSPSITDSVMRRIQKDIPAPARRRLSVLQKQIRWLSAAAAVIFILVLTLTNSTNKNSLVWAQVAQQVQQARSCSYRMEITTNGVMFEEVTPIKDRKINSIFLFSENHGMKIKSFMNDQIVNEDYINPKNNTDVKLIAPSKKYSRRKYDEGPPYRIMDPREIFKQLSNCRYTSLGRDIIDGIEAEGVESTDWELGGGFFDTFHIRLWSNVHNGWPVRVEYSGTKNNAKIKMDYIIYDFQWNIDIDPAEFEYTIPDDYTELSSSPWPDLNADTTIEGLKKYLEVVGCYPDTLNTETLRQQYVKVLKSNPDISENAIMKESNSIQLLGMFYMQLVRQNKEPKYYGETVTPEDANAMLLRWKSGEDEYTAIFGDLHTETLAPDQLTQLESQLPH